jgi:uncharacterized membrane protein
MTVLYEYKYNGGADALIFLMVVISAMLIGSMLARWVVNDLPTYEKTIISILTAVISFGMVYGIIKLPQVMATTRYKVKMEEKVDLNEFLMQYKIVETEGDIIVVEQVEHGE